MIDLAQIEAALTIGKWIKKHFTVNKVNPLVSRFISLFEKHGVHRNEIPHFFGHGLTLADIASNKKLLSKLTPEMQQSACKLFAVRLKWLHSVLMTGYMRHTIFINALKNMPSFLPN